MLKPGNVLQLKDLCRIADILSDNYKICAKNETLLYVFQLENSCKTHICISELHNSCENDIFFTLYLEDSCSNVEFRML